MELVPTSTKRQRTPIGEYVRTRRESLQLTQRELSSRAGVGGATVYRLENGVTDRLSAKTVTRLSAALNVDESEIRAVFAGQQLRALATNVCFPCWEPGSVPDKIWNHPLARNCYRCGTELSPKCKDCGYPILISARFCPNCGKPYRASRS
jgi:transcriptional regulator with XRE-family HTH domain